MIDRASTFADPELNQLLKENFVPAAIDQFRQRQQKDAEGDFWRKILVGARRSDPNDTTQGLYVATAGGRLLVMNNNRGPDRLRQLLEGGLKKFSAESSEGLQSLTNPEPDPRFDRTIPPGAAVIKAQTKVLTDYPETEKRWRRFLQGQTSRDNLWISAREQKKCAEGVLPESMLQRIIRYHLVDNTRGEPQFWREDEIKSVIFELSQDNIITGRVSIEKSDGSTGYEAECYGNMKTDPTGKLESFELIFKGDYWGEGRYTRGAPPGKFPVGVRFELVAPDERFATIPPQGTKGSLKPYWNQ